ncbi:MraY family glycosyltransferase [Streptosporangium carneum]|uniref:Undecaprenyl-phosphate alpha-N-acetylglucosaminyl 1-phosphate transferase n=1 Tax=Streptosporangium carneum TaxID=47481 RepID=A0A9W6HYH7_9ACTN|nr:undecaprenyl/decaprenyl-phosphate alpha-N-acetylglucosaminyl 1-phosphate transferase [Streptosporangium carneum]GLK08106.1 undecaprenyl-phosphate alpha-N-acetylglucosaminyl 1-phosphate transferase [Streptosporangium carneum]
MREYLLMALVAAAATYLLVPLVRVFAIRIGAMPEVRDRDVHTIPTPRLGGLAMYGGLVAGLLIASHLPYAGGKLAEGNTAIALIAAGGLITVTGFLDDWWGMSALVKLAGQIGAAGILVAFGVSLPWLPLPTSLGGQTSLDSTLSPLITILVVVVMINAVNFVDGLDGLAAGIVGIAAMATWTYSVALSKDYGNTSINVTAVVTSVLIGVCLGFLPHNFHPAKIFMGDTGAMLIGLVLASTMITITPLDSTTINRFPVVLPLLVPVAILVLPLLDLIMAVIRRTSNGLSPFAPDRGHLHHRLLDIGHSHRRTVLIMYAWTFLFAFAVVAMSFEGVPLVLFPLTFLLAVVVLVMMALPRWRARRGGGGGTGGDGGGDGDGGAHAAGRHSRPEGQNTSEWFSPAPTRAPSPTQAPGPAWGPGPQQAPGAPQAPGPRSPSGENTSVLSALPDLSLTAPSPGFSDPETLR